MRRRDMLIGAGSALLLAGGGGAAGWRALVGSMDDFDAYTRRLRVPLPAAPEIVEIIRYATLAANGHNTQPWRFHVEESAIDPDDGCGGDATTKVRAWVSFG